MQQSEPIFVHAVYQDGVIKPTEPLNLENEAKIQLLIMPDPSGSEKEAPGSLFGAFPELAALSDDDLAWAKRLREYGVEKLTPC